MSEHIYASSSDVVGNLRKIAERGSDVHSMDWKAIVANAGFGANEIERLRRQNEELISHLHGISRQTAAMVAANSKE